MKETRKGKKRFDLGSYCRTQSSSGIIYVQREKSAENLGRWLSVAQVKNLQHGNRGCLLEILGDSAVEGTVTSSEQVGRRRGDQKMAIKSSEEEKK